MPPARRTRPGRTWVCPRPSCQSTCQRSSSVPVTSCAVSLKPWRKRGLHPRYLEIELTESVMHDAPQLVGMLGELKRIGVQIAIDDFGTGYSSLSSLKRFPVDRLKIDRSFVEHIAVDPDDAAIVRTIIALGRNLGLNVVAEGVKARSRCSSCSSTPAMRFRGISSAARSPPAVRSPAARKLPTAGRRSGQRTCVRPRTVRRSCRTHPHRY